MTTTSEQPRKTLTMQERVVRVGRRIGNWQYVVDRYNGDRWRLDGTTVDLEWDPIGASSRSKPGCWALYIGDRYMEPVSAYLTGYCCAMETVEKIVGLRGPRRPSDEIPDPSWAAEARTQLATSDAGATT